jgi:hypothetical protein
LAASPRPGFSHGFLKAIDAALALQPENRPQSAAELRDLLAIDDTPTAASPRENAERMLDALHVDEAITAIVSAEEMADIAAQLAGAPAVSTASPETAPSPAAPASSQASALLVDPMAAPSPVPAAQEFKDVEDLVSGKLLPNNEDVRVVSESRLEARIDTEQHSASPRRAPWLALSALLGCLVVAGAGLGWALKGEDAAVPSAASVASTAETLSGERTTTAQANREPSDDANRPRPEQGEPFAPEPGSARLAPLAAADPSPPSIFAQTPPANAANPSPAVRFEDRQPQPGAAIPDDIWAQAGSTSAPAWTQESEDGDDGLAVVDLRQQQGPAAPRTAGPETTQGGSASPGIAAAPQPVRRTASAPDLVSVRLGISPWAEVWLGKERKGVSPPLRELRLPPGRHSVELRNSAFPAKTVVIEVRPGEHPAIEHRFGQANQ